MVPITTVTGTFNQLLTGGAHYRLNYIQRDQRGLFFSNYKLIGTKWGPVYDSKVGEHNSKFTILLMVLITSCN